jgi:hypothetical protein
MRHDSQPYCLGCGDFDIVDIVAIPDRLEQGVAEPEYEDVLHRFFTQVMVNPINVALIEGPSDRPVELSSAL